MGFVYQRPEWVLFTEDLKVISDSIIGVVTLVLLTSRQS